VQFDSFAHLGVELEYFIYLLGFEVAAVAPIIDSVLKHLESLQCQSFEYLVLADGTGAGE
jgi:hypothetical protein